MSKYFILPLLFVLALALAAPLTHAQTASVRGTCKDLDGKPIAGAQVEWDSADTGRKTVLKTNNKGEYFSLGFAPGKYNIKLTKDGKEIFHINGVAIVSGDNPPVDVDLKKEQAAAAAGQGLSAEQLKQEQEQREKVNKENNTIKALNEKITEANTDITAGDFDKAIADSTEAIRLDPTLAGAYNNRGLAYAEKGDFDKAVSDYSEAIRLRASAHLWVVLAK